jgi:hypothetical protein
MADFIQTFDLAGLNADQTLDAAASQADGTATATTGDPFWTLTPPKP